MNTTTTNTGVEVKKTKDYSMFKTLEGNRAINKPHMERLKKSMQEVYLICPIIVNQRHEIIDGQHRYEAAKELGLPIFYIVVKNYGLSEVQRFNANQKNFSFDDYLLGYCDLGMDEYIIIKEFKAKYRLTWRAVFLFLTGDHSSDTTEKFKNGQLKIKDLRKADVLASRLNDFSGFEFYQSGLFINAFYRMAGSKKYDHAQMLTKLEYLSGRMKKRSSTMEYVAMLEEIYNYKNRSEYVNF